MPLVVRLPLSEDALDALIAAGADAVELDGTDVLGLFRGGDEGGVRERVARLLGTEAVRVEAPELLDWSSTWRPSLRPYRVGPLTIAFDGEPAPDRLVLDPAGAFGTGLHPSTRLCLRWLAAHRPTGAVLDVGTGTGILALAALRLGASRAVGTDHDPTARAAAERNASANHLLLDVRDAAPDALGERFPLILANLLAAPLVALAPALGRAVLPGGRILASGFTADRAEEVVGAFRHVGLRVVGEDAEGAWALRVIAPSW